MSGPAGVPPSPADDRAARTGLAHRRRADAVLAVEGPDRSAFLQGQLTQDVSGLAPGQARPAAGLTAKGKLLYFGTIVALPDALLLLIEAEAAPAAASHLSKFAAFQKVTVRDASAEYSVTDLYGPEASGFAPPDGALALPPDGERAAGILVSASDAVELDRRLSAAGSVPVSEQTAEVLRVEAGRPRLLRDAGPENLPDEAGLAAAIAPNKGCYVGQEVVARLRTYGRVNRRLVGFRFAGGPVAAGATFPSPERPDLILARVTSSVVSPRFGAIGLGTAFRDVGQGDTLKDPADSRRVAWIAALPFA